MIRKIVRTVVSAEPDLEVVGHAANGKIALAMIDQVSPDVVILDIEMPVMGGLETLVEMKRLHPQIPVVVFSAWAEHGATVTLDALSAGAHDYALKPKAKSLGDAQNQLRKDLVVKTRHAGELRLSTGPQIRDPAARSVSPTRPKRSTGNGPVKIVAMGMSTGGPDALGEVITRLPEDFPVPLVITQHMPAVFTRKLAERLDSKCALRIREGEQGAELEPGAGYIAPGGHHMLLAESCGEVRLKITDDPPENFCRPAVDPLFRSAAMIYQSGVLGVVLTGMGRDGLLGSRAIVGEGGRVIVQDQETSVVWGMPGFIAQEGLAEQVLPLDQIAPCINRQVRGAHASAT